VLMVALTHGPQKPRRTGSSLVLSSSTSSV
jgi:hypothetical protein